MPGYRPLYERFDEKYIPEPNSGCWLWTGSLNSDGYGNIGLSRSRRTEKAYRISYERYKGPIPDHLEIDHKCRVRSCVNPDHLRVVTHKENMGNAVYALSLRTHCPRGHPYDEGNTYIRKDGARSCRACNRERHRRKRGSVAYGHWNRGKTHCIRGHEFTPENTRVSRAGKRQCRHCVRDWWREKQCKHRSEESSRRTMRV